MTYVFKTDDHQEARDQLFAHNYKHAIIAIREAVRQKLKYDESLTESDKLCFMAMQSDINAILSDQQVLEEL